MYMSREEFNRCNNIYLFYDILRIGIATVSDFNRVHKAGDIRLIQSEKQKIFSKLGLLNSDQHFNEDRTLSGLPNLQFITSLSKDTDLIKFSTVRRIFQFFDHDGNGLITESDLQKVLNPIAVNEQ